MKERLRAGGNNKPLAPKGVRCKVTSVLEGKGYFVAVELANQSTKQESITCSIENWKADDLPEPGDIVIMERVRQTGKGWRAHSASPVVMEVNSNAATSNKVSAR